MPAVDGMDMVLATRNPGKVREFNRLLAAASITVAPLPGDVDLPPEDGSTFQDNALPKARAAAAATGTVALADDSGIEAAALNGRPGVCSARFAGDGASDQENLDKLMHEAPAGSRLRYVCALAYVDLVSGVEEVFFGTCDGRLAEQPRGTRGFGYDPAFLPDGEYGGRTMAELADAEKDAISHRAVAVSELVAWLCGRPR